jgi:hypothetical protein
VVSFSPNFGHQAAVPAALDRNRDAVVMTDEDLQAHEVIPRFVELYHQGYDVVYAQRVRSKEGWSLRFCYFVELFGRPWFGVVYTDFVLLVAVPLNMNAIDEILRGFSACERAFGSARQPIHRRFAQMEAAQMILVRVKRQSNPMRVPRSASMIAWWTSSPIYFASVTRVLLPVGVDANDQNLL